MDTLFTPNVPDEAEDIPQTDEPIWILGRKYNAIKELDAIRRDIRSKLWFTYRKGFIPIGGCNSTFTSDKGWGCMLRCGQMVLAQALITLHLGKDWQWMPETKNKTYLKILRRFEDKRAAAFSIHQIALMGASEGKEVGQWFGPNTIAQVLKKLVVYDEWSSLTIHVALDNTLIVNDILRQCRVEGGVTAEADGEIPLRAPSQWKPLLLLVPLRLGLSEINPVYINGLKTSFKISQSLGVIGGKPNLALYFIGCVGDEVIYLDPHTTQRSGSIEDKMSEEEIEMDSTYHCKSASRIPVTDMDPSVALCFFCATEKEFKSLCKSMQEELILPEKQPLFELCTERLAHWSPAEDAVSEAIAASSFASRKVFQVTLPTVKNFITIYLAVDMMTLGMKSMLLAFLIITTFSEERSQDIPLFLQNEFLNFLFPKDPGLVRVRKIDRAEGMDSGKVLDFIGLVEQYNYPAEEHNVTTEDGYNLKIHRIPGSPLLESKKKKEIVFIQHGILASSDSWVLYGPGKDLAFLLADQGYDVWIGNMRGNSYCRSHVNITTYDPKFWQYSFHEIGTKDLPAMFDYILNYTKQKDLYYIGHSMGGTALFTFLSSRPEYNMKIKMAICLAPASFWMKISPTLNELITIFPTIKEILRQRETYDVFPQSLATVTIARMLCNDNAMTQIICVTVLFLITGPDPAQLNTTTLPDLLSYIPAGSSIQSLEHFYQNIRIKDFRNYDYGIAENYKRYKQKIPPSYDLEKITAPIILFYSANDMVVTKENVLELGKRLPNVLLIEEVPFKFFNHVDFVWAINVKTLLYDRVLELIQKFDTDQNKSMK